MSISRKTCFEALQKAADELGHKPTVGEYKALDISPSYNTIIARYGTWSTALDHIDADEKPGIQYTKEDCIEALQAPAEEFGEEPSIYQYKRSGRSPSANTIVRRFGSWEEAKATADVHGLGE
jgi:hypothetical protein